MAKSTSKEYRNQVMYSVFVRNYSLEGTFDGVRRDLDRIRDLGVDIVWLMPIHPIGKAARKGSLGSPYAIRDYTKINPEYGTIEDFRLLVDAIHDNMIVLFIGNRKWHGDLPVDRLAVIAHDYLHDSPPIGSA